MKCFIINNQFIVFVFFVEQSADYFLISGFFFLFYLIVKRSRGDAQMSDFVKDQKPSRPDELKSSLVCRSNIS